MGNKTNWIPGAMIQDEFVKQFYRIWIHTFYILTYHGIFQMKVIDINEHYILSCAKFLYNE
jgi:hypothetical protein